MALARPFLGFGPNQFRFAYPAFQAPGQIDGRTGYPVVEAAHNLEADTATSFGLLGLAALIACGVLAGMVVFRSIAGRREDAALATALGLGLLCGVVALQFHYVTMDTGPPLAVLLSGLVWVEARQRDAEAWVASPAASRAAGWSLAAVGLAYAGAAIMVAGLIGADRAEARAASLAAAKAPWPVVRAELARAESLAPWEAQIIRARGTIATAVLGRRFDSAVAVDGIKAFDAAVAMTPADAVLASERGNLMLAAGLTAKDSGLLKRAITTFAEAERMDPNTGIAMAGRASALLALGRTNEAIKLFERAVLLSPRYGEGWRNLALAYRTAGRNLDARRATERADKWSRRP
jgi:Flp pilus assembly protein TadD